ncbi:MAG: cellulase family glycosylhydrolase [Pseudomonadota bacterium]
MRASEGKFRVSGANFYSAGTNAYYLQVYQKLNSNVVDTALDLFAANDVRVIRIWAFYDGSDCGTLAGEPVIQTAAEVYDETALTYLDQVVKKIKDRGLYVILTAANYWQELGGVCQYVKWDGFAGAGGHNPTAAEANHFFTSAQIKTWYKAYLSMLANRVNTATGVAYKDEPVIFSWELMNEARNPGANESILRDWYQEMAKYLKSIDTNHMVATGEEGFDEGSPSAYATTYSNTYFMRAGEGTSYIANTAIPEIDFAGMHVYPDVFGFNPVGVWAADGSTYITDHAAIAAAAVKPMIVGEYGSGWNDGWTADSTFKNDVYTTWWSTIEGNASIGADLVWQFTAATKCSESGGNICSTRDTTITGLLKDHGARMKAKS